MARQEKNANRRNGKDISPPTDEKPQAVRREKGRIWSYVRQKWLVETPEEKVRQEYLIVLLNEYGYSLEQMREEEPLTGRGTAHARADFVVWQSSQDRRDKHNPIIIVECKSDNVTISEKDYWQGDAYARQTGAKFLVTHNSKETKYWRIVHDRMPKTMEEIEGIPHADATDKEIEELISRLKVFKEEEFAQLLHQCHNVIRNREKKDPAAAFDEIAKILFVKVDIERRLTRGRARRNLFTAAFLDEQSEIHDDPMNVLFKQTKDDYREDHIFDEDETINLRFNTAREIVRLLEKYNLSDTSEDIKGIAFERFLGRTFRGEIGQFFTPRTIVEFMIRMVDPKERETICDPASGSGGFLIRFFEIVREQILRDVDQEYHRYREEIEAKRYKPEKKAQLLRERFEKLQEGIEQKKSGSRVWHLSNCCIYGTDANDRMARTSKMNMIMHGDGHGGVHHHDGFINVNGIFEERFDIVLTNPPFGANVEPSDLVLESDVAVSDEDYRRYAREYGDAYKEAHACVKAAEGKPITSLFKLPKTSESKVKTEILFMERCLGLLKPGGRLGIVLPEGVLNNPSLAYVREFCENRAFLRAVISLPPDTFVSSGASVKASLVFMQKFTKEEQADFDTKRDRAERETRAKHAAEISKRTRELDRAVAAAKKAEDTKRWTALRDELRQYQRDMEAKIQAEARALLKERFPYPIFLYEAEHVGITATGETDRVWNELVPNDCRPAGVEKTALELYREFQTNPQPFLMTEARV